jgi:uncharacterized membrane protein YphA (DoxX/SURF4 family)
MNNSIVNYFLARIGIFVAVFCILLLIGIEPILAALFAAVISLAISLIFLQKQRDRVSEAIYARANRAKAQAGADGETDVENDLLDSAEDLDKPDAGNAPKNQ